MGRNALDAVLDERTGAQSRRASSGSSNEPGAHGCELDDPATTNRRRDIIHDKVFLRRIYEEWYKRIASALPGDTHPVLEVGAGAGFLAQFVPGLIASDILRCEGIDVVLDATRLPLRDRSLGAIVLTNVLHHIKNARRFIVEAARCVRPGGAILLIEPWVTPWSRFVYTRFHHEPFDPDSPSWELEEGGPLSGANQALPWFLFERDRVVFEREFPMWRIAAIEPMMPFRYLVSGGFATRASLAPSWSWRFWSAFESALQPWMPRLAMFAFIHLRRTEAGC